jgi:Transcriptional regulator PadR-like family
VSKARCSRGQGGGRALVVGYWYQFVQGEAEFTGQTINSALKHLGYRAANITTAFDRLQAQRPALVVQVRKSGTSKQARKKYKLTNEGKRAVEQMIASAE